MPATRSVSQNIHEMMASHGGESAWPRKRIIAASINMARAKGAKIPPPKERRGLKKLGT